MARSRAPSLRISRAGAGARSRREGLAHISLQLRDSVAHQIIPPFSYSIGTIAISHFGPFRLLSEEPKPRASQACRKVQGERSSLKSERSERSASSVGSSQYTRVALGPTGDGDSLRARRACQLSLSLFLTSSHRRQLKAANSAPTRLCSLCTLVSSTSNGPTLRPLRLRLPPQLALLVLREEIAPYHTGMYEYATAPLASVRPAWSGCSLR